MQIDLAIDEVLKRYGASLDPVLLSRVFNEAFAHIMGDTGQAGALTEGERHLLSEADLGEADAATVLDVARRSAAEQAELLATALPAAQVAGQLGVDPSRVRQQIASRELFALRHGREWRLPLFQFEATGTGLRRVPNAGRVMRALPPGLAGIAVARWFTMPSPELRETGPDAPDAPMSPKDWLLKGLAMEPVVHLAAQLAGTPQGGEQTLPVALPAATLTDREKECLRWAIGGKTTAETGRILGISERTVMVHLENVAQKLDVADRSRSALHGSVRPAAKREAKS